MDEIRYVEAEVHYLQHADGSWSLVGRDGWPMDVETYREQAAELEADVSELESLGLAIIDIEPLSVRDTEARRELDQ